MSHEVGTRGFPLADAQSRGTPSNKPVATATDSVNLKGKFTRSQKARNFKNLARMVSLSLHLQESRDDVKNDPAGNAGVGKLASGEGVGRAPSSKPQSKGNADRDQAASLISRKQYRKHQEENSSSFSDDPDLQASRKQSSSAGVKKTRKTQESNNINGNKKVVSRSKGDRSDLEGDVRPPGNYLTVKPWNVSRGQSFDSQPEKLDRQGDLNRRKSVSTINPAGLPADNRDDDRKVKFDQKNSKKVKDTQSDRLTTSDVNKIKKQRQKLNQCEAVDGRNSRQGDSSGLPYLAELKEKLTSLGKDPDDQESFTYYNEDGCMPGLCDDSQHLSHTVSHDLPPSFNYAPTLIELENYINSGGGRRVPSTGNLSGPGFMQTPVNDTRISRQKNNHISSRMEANYSDGGSSEGEIDSYRNRDGLNNGQTRHGEYLNNDSPNIRNRRKSRGDIYQSENKSMKGESREPTPKQGRVTRGRRMNDQDYYSDEELVDGAEDEYVMQRRTEKQTRRQRVHEMSDSRSRSSKEGDRDYGPNVIVTEANVHLSQEEIEDLDKMDANPRQRKQSGDKQNESSIRRNDRKYRSHNNLSRPMTNDDREMEQARMSKNASQYYTPRPRRKQSQGKFDSRLSSDDELRDLSNHIDPRHTQPMSRAGSVTDMARVGDFSMPKSKMGSFQDFKPIKHSQSSTRVSTDKGKINSNSPFYPPKIH